MHFTIENLRKYVILTAATTAIVGVALTIYVLIPPIPVHHINVAIDKIKFFPVTPPSTLRGPGTIYYVTDDGQPHSALCTVPSKLLDQVLERSVTEMQVVQEFRKVSFAIDADLEKNLKASVKGGIIESVTFSLEDVSVHEVSLANLRMLSREMQKEEDCANTVEEYVNAGKHVCQGQQALKATARYSVRMNRQADTSVAVEAVRDAVRANIDPKAEYDGSRVTSGVGLYYGIRLAHLCHAIRGAPPAPPPARVNRIS